MDNTKIEEALARLFIEEDQRIVFWNDPDQEFAITLSLLNLPDGVSILRLDNVGALEAKIRMEREDPHGKYLLYSPSRRTGLRRRLAPRYPSLQPKFPGGQGLHDSG